RPQRHHRQGACVLYNFPRAHGAVVAHLDRIRAAGARLVRRPIRTRLPSRRAGAMRIMLSVCGFAVFVRRRSKEVHMPESVYKIITLVGTSTESWEKAAKAAVERAGKTLRDLRVAEIAELDMQLDNGKVEAYRAKVRVSFKFEGKD